MILIVVAVLALIVIFVIAMYNGLVRLKVQCDNAWSDIDVQLKRRYDLIPNLVATVQGYAAHEKGTLEGVVEARNRAMSATGPAAKGEAEGMLTSALRQCLRWLKRIRNCAPWRASRRCKTRSRKSKTRSRTRAATTMPWCAT